MRKTLTLTVEPDMAQFILNQQGLADPSALINKLIHEDMQRKGVRVDPALKARMEQDEISQSLELQMDEDIQAAG